jgi:HSP90 family molecular chaperone
MSTEVELIREIKENLETGGISEAELDTDERVLARITDGIYRQPASALRELIANAYDADAENVYIQTDAPRFSKITVRDDGNGLSIEALANLIHHIGGSPKRTKAGVGLGVVNKKDSSLSPGGRRLIGKIGIGLFSVAQLTRHFQIITKTKGTDYRLVGVLSVSLPESSWLIC